MKRNLYYIFMVLFILAACVPSPESLDQDATATQISTENAYPWLTFPAPLPNETGEMVEIPSSNYPDSDKNFIAHDMRTNEKKLEIIRFLAPEDYQKEIDLYKSEIKRMGLNENNFEYIASVVNKKSWAIVPKNIKTGEIYVPSINNLIQASLHLFGYLDKALDDDFFDLIPVNIPNATVIGDKSGWHVVVEKNHDSISKWYDAKNDKIRTDLTANPETYSGIAIETDPTTPFEQLPKVTYEDFKSGKVLEAERKYLENHNPFNGNEIWPTEFRILNDLTISGVKYGTIKAWRTELPIRETYFKDPYLFPARNMFYFNISFPQDLFSIIDGIDYSKLGYTLVGQVWLNPDSKTNKPEDKYRILHYPFFTKLGDRIVFYDIPGDISKTYIPIPVYSLNFDKGNSPNILATNIDKILYQEFYEKGKAAIYLKEWVEKGIMPPELEKFLFIQHGHKY